MNKSKEKCPPYCIWCKAGTIQSMGGKARAAKLSPERRKEIAKKAVAAREAKRKTGKE